MPEPREPDSREPEQPEESEQAEQASAEAPPEEPGGGSEAVATPGEEPAEQQRAEAPESDDSRDPLEDTVEMAAIRWDADDEATDPEETAESSDEAVEQPTETGSAAGPQEDGSEPDASSEDGSDDLAGAEPEPDEPAADAPAVAAPSPAKTTRRVPASDAEEPRVAEAEADSEADSQADGKADSPAAAAKDPAAAKDEGAKPAAAARTSTPAQDRLVKALLKPSRRQVVVAVLLGLLGFAAVTQVRANEVDDSYAGLRQQDLIDTLNNLSNAERRADAEIARLQQDKEELENSTNRREAAIAQAKQLTDTLDILAGVVPVTGPGLRITIEETEQEIDIDTMIDTVQELRNAGAESMEFNDEVRVVAQTSLQQGVGGIEIDGTLLEPPYVIDVIGDPDTLESSGMRFPTGPLEQLGDDQATTTIDRSSGIEIASVVEERDPEHLEQE